MKDAFDLTEVVIIHQLLVDAHLGHGPLQRNAFKAYFRTATQARRASGCGTCLDKSFGSLSRSLPGAQESEEAETRWSLGEGADSLEIAR